MIQALWTAAFGLLIGTAFLSSAGAQAIQEQRQGQTAASPKPSVVQAQPQQAPAGAGPASGQERERGQPVDAAQLRTRTLVGREVRNARGQEVGEIEDVVVGKHDQALYAAIEVGGFLGIGDKAVVLPLDQLWIGANNVVLMSQQTEEQLKALPAYDKGLYAPYEP